MLRNLYDIYFLVVINEEEEAGGQGINLHTIIIGKDEVDMEIIIKLTVPTRQYQ